MENLNEEIQTDGKPIKKNLIKSHNERNASDRKARNHINGMVDDRVKEYTVQVIQHNKEIEKLKKKLDEYMNFLENNKNAFAGQGILEKKVEALKRLVVATKYGLDRSKFKLYDINQNIIRDDIMNQES